MQPDNGAGLCSVLRTDAAKRYYIGYVCSGNCSGETIRYAFLMGAQIDQRGILRQYQINNGCALKSTGEKFFVLDAANACFCTALHERVKFFTAAPNDTRLFALIEQCSCHCAARSAGRARDYDHFPSLKTKPLECAILPFVSARRES